MFYSQNFAPNETFESYGSIPKVIESIFKKSSSSIAVLEKKILDTHFPTIQNYLTCTMFFSGRSALYHLLKSIGIEPGSEVIVQSFTCTAVVTPIIYAGFKPVYADINESDFSSMYDSVVSKITNLTKVIILQHTFGIRPSNKEKIVDLCREKNIFLIEDLAHGLYPSSFKTPENFDKYAVLLSFGRSKLISSVFGACIVTPNHNVETNLRIAQKSLSKASKYLIFQCISYKYLTPVIKSAFSASQLMGKSLHYAADFLHFFPDEVVTQEKMGNFYGSFDCKYPEILSELLIFELAKLPNILERNHKNAQLYAHELNIQNANPILRFPYICKDAEQKNKVLSHFKQKNIILGTWYESPVAPIDADLAKLGYRLGECPNCENICNRLVNLPLTVDPDIAAIIASEMKLVLEKA